MGLEEIRKMKEAAKLPKGKKIYKIPKVSPKRAAKIKEERAQRKAAGGNELDRWFIARRKGMTGICQHCGGKSTKDDDKYFKFSICHILPKRIFKSVATHPDNWIELCYFGDSCHTNMDNATLDLIDMNCFDTIIERFVKIYPHIAPSERKYIPDILILKIES